jgi:hypothetical protein
LGHIALAIGIGLVALIAAKVALDLILSPRVGKSIIGWKDPVRTSYDKTSEVFVLKFINLEIAEITWQRIGDPTMQRQVS